MFAFEKLRVFENTRKLVEEIYGLTRRFPDDEKFGLTSQLRRAAISISSNIAEGSGRVSFKEKTHFVEIAYGSLSETYCQLLLAVDIGYLGQKDIDNVARLYYDISHQLTALKYSYKKEADNQDKQELQDKQDNKNS